MNMILIHFILAVMLFLIQNWIGGRAYSVGYIKFSLLDDKDEALAINFVIKVFGPVVFLILVVAIFQYFNLSVLNKEIINVIYLYIGIRVLLIVLNDRLLVVNWIKIGFYYVTVFFISKYIYDNFLLSVTDLLPDFSQIKNEVWLLILFFVYQIANGFDVKYSNNALQETTIAYLPELLPRKKKYIQRKFRTFKRKYNQVIEGLSSGNEEFTVMILSVIIFENFNRPYLVRIFENLWFRTFGRSTVGTTGIMQSKANRILSDVESVRSGTEVLFKAYQIFLAEDTSETYGRNSIRRTIKRHCKDRMYVRQILFICKAILDNEYSSVEKETKFKYLLVEIKEEFGLYDTY